MKKYPLKITQKLVPLFIYLLFAVNGIGQNNNNLIPFASGITSPVDISNAGDDRLFVVSQRGYIQIVSSSGTIVDPFFLDIRDRVVYGGERGLLGLAFHPQYKTNGYFFVNYTGDGNTTHISRFQVNPNDSNLANPQSELIIISIEQPYANHNGGDLCFGPDGYLYIGMGDGGSGGDPGNRAQNPKQLLGKMLRLDIDNGNPYSIPITNPFYGSTAVLPEIWASGLRNPWRFSFDKLTGDLWIGDVGQNSVEEVNFQPTGSNGGENYGWKCYEGNQVYSNAECNTDISLTFPAFTYPQGQECSVTGGYVYRGIESSPFYGKYFFTDYCSDRIWTLHKVGEIWVKEDFGRFTGNNFSTFGEDAAGQLYVAGIVSGKIFRINDQATGVSTFEKPMDIKISHIPFSTIIKIETGSNNFVELNICIYNLNGVKLFEKNFNEYSFEFNTGAFSQGIYFLKATMNGRSHIQKVVLGN